MNLEGLTEKRWGNKSLWYENGNGEVVAKRCGKCKEIKLLGRYSKHKTNKGGRQTICKSCEKENSAKWLEKNKDRHQEYNKLWRKNNKTHIAEYMREKYKENKEPFIARNKRWRNLNKGYVKKKAKEYYEVNKEHLIEASRNYYDLNKEYYREYRRKWRIDNPEKVSVYNHLRRARKAGLIDTLTTEEYNITLKYFEYSCALTGQSFDLEKEHAIPLSIGHGGTTFENCYPMAAGLNQSKYNKNIFEWFETNRQRFELSQEKFDTLIGWLASANAMSVEEYRDYVYWCHANPRTMTKLTKLPKEEPQVESRSK